MTDTHDVLSVSWTVMRVLVFTQQYVVSVSDL
jgi:hypothetical protein